MSSERLPGPETVEFDFEARLTADGMAPLHRQQLTTLQLNITTRCNLACHHCHVESGPLRREALDRGGPSACSSSWNATLQWSCWTSQAARPR